jgi:hypothetical protein
MSTLPLRLTWISFSTRVTGIVLIKDIGIDPKATMESGFTFPPGKCPLAYYICHPISAMSPPDIDTSRMEMSESTGRHGRGISTGKGTEEGNGMEKTGGNMTDVATIEGEAEEDTAIKPVLTNRNECSGERVQWTTFPQG